jgi:hypothetical protein
MCRFEKSARGCCLLDIGKSKVWLSCGITCGLTGARSLSTGYCEHRAGSSPYELLCHAAEQ